MTRTSPENTLSPRYLRETDAADILSVSIRTLQGWRLKGGGPPFVRFGSCIRYKLNELCDWAERQVYTSTSAADAVNRGVSGHD